MGSPSIRAIAFSRNGLEAGVKGDFPIAIGTAIGELWLVNEGLSITDVTRGHNHDLRGLAPNPQNRHSFATCGHDKRLAIWDAGRRCMVKYRNLHCGAKA